MGLAKPLLAITAFLALMSVVSGGRMRSNNLAYKRPHNSLYAFGIGESLRYRINHSSRPGLIVSFLLRQAKHIRR